VGPPERPARLTVPSEYDAATPSPLVLVLHGYGANGAAQSVYFGLPRLLRREAFYVLAPDGTLDEAGLRHWDVRGETVDDHAYLRGLIEDTRAAVPVSEVFVLGHSNGGFMAYRLACDSADLVDGIVSLAGSEALERCAPERPVSVLQIHGTADDTVLFDGGEIRGYAYASASQVVATWAARLGCDPSIERLPAIDLVGEVEGAETRVESYRGACRDGTAAELWAMEGAGHIPGLTAGFASDVLAWLRAR
jgi:polyhydroxybutyrate depolymerase